MAGFKNKFLNRSFPDERNSASKHTLSILKKSWSELPDDFTFGERSLFIEVAERLVKIANITDDRAN